MSLIIGGNTIDSADVDANGKVVNLPQYELPMDGLLFHLNATNYAGTSPWYDDCQNIPMNSQNTINPKTTVNGIPAMQFNNSGYWDSSTADGQKVDMTGEFTLVFIINPQQPNSRHTIFEKIANTYASYEQELAVTWETGNDFSYYTQYNSYDYASTNVMTLNQWNILAIRNNAERTAGYYWKNGQWNLNYTDRSSAMVVRANGVRVGNGYAGIVESGYLHAVLVYGVALPATRMQSVHDYYSNLFSLAGVTLYN